MESITYVQEVSNLSSYPAASLSHRFGKTPSPARSPVDALIDLVAGGRLCRQIPMGLNVHPVIHLRITTVTSQRRPACRGDAWWLRVGTDVLQNLPDQLQWRKCDLVHREAAVLVGQHLFGVTTLQQAPAHEGAQNSTAQGGLTS